MRFDTASLQVTLINLSNTTIALAKAGEEAVLAAGAVLLSESRKTVGLRDHSLTDLWLLDHPYARRHKTIRIHTSTPWQVHRKPSPLNPKHRNQQDELYNATRGLFYRVGRTPVYEVYFDTGAAPHAVFVTQGTRVMLPRDPLWRTATDPDVTKKIMVGIVRRLGKELRGKVGIRFGTGSPTSTGGRVGSLGVR